ncbi:NADP-dependent oxidoreductase domain-containing protein [Pterulicium gracile]|uniref:NADP-dependent oxidoreductase domain-containing protein n=1 Tax=Pterulicium gracile TaxID=1884261 RepID=A0A5C3Q6Q0_9AGAR|nr:NADP-dependent oxidoreductase domain-containing protein [Pterula gracilis]
MSSTTSYPTRQLGKNGPFVSAIGFGAMGIGSAIYGPDASEEEKGALLTAAADKGVTFWDTSDFYMTSEANIGAWFAKTSRRSEIFLATKFGGSNLEDHRFSAPRSEPAYILRRLANSLQDLQTDYIDLYYQHRVDPTVPIEVVLETLRPAVEKGTIRYLGLSECSVETLRRAKAVPGLGEKVVAAQMEFSPFEISIETNGFVAAARELGVAIVAYSPLGRGLISGRYRSRDDFPKDDFRLGIPRFSEENFPKNVQLVDKFQDIARKYDTTPAQVALAWILAEHKDFFPIPGTRTIERLNENAQGALLKLSDEDVKIIRKLVDEAAVVSGSRYTEAYLSSPGMSGNCIAMSEWKGE